VREALNARAADLSIDGRAPQAECVAAAVGQRPAFHQLERGRDLVGGERLTVEALATSTGGGDAILRPLGYQTPLEVRDRPKHVKDQFRLRQVGVDLLLQVEQRDGALSVTTVVSNSLNERPRRSRRTTASQCVPSRAYASGGLRWIGGR
jgi:hypothetical protein